MPRIRSDIPKEAEERLVSEYRQKGPLIYLQIIECIFRDQVVGQRAYNGDGILVRETALKDNKKHGREFVWNDEGTLESVEPYFEGKLHGVAKQYSRKGKIIGTDRCVHGTGFDIWRSEGEDGPVGISEIHSLQDGMPHGYEWWLKEDQRSLWHEHHWREGISHGIERMWNNKDTLKRGYPKFWIQGQAVSKRVYLKAAKGDSTLPVFRAEDNRPQRRFPPEIENLLTR